MKRYGLIVLSALLLLFLTATPVSAAEKPCPKSKIVKKFWCETCKEIREFNECSAQTYVWDWKAHKEGERNPHMFLPEGWGCQTAGYYCIRCGKCYLSPGICADCNDDTESRKSLAKVEFKCPDGHSHSAPGTGFKLKEGLYEEEIENAGSCPTCGKPLEVICSKSGTCPHVGK